MVRNAPDQNVGIGPERNRGEKRHPDYIGAGQTLTPITFGAGQKVTPIASGQYIFPCFAPNFAKKFGLPRLRFRPDQLIAPSKVDAW